MCHFHQGKDLDRFSILLIQNENIFVKCWSILRIIIFFFFFVIGKNTKDQQNI